MRIQIKRGDTLTKLARRFGTSVRSLARANHLRDPDRIVAGRALNITGRAGGDSFEPDRSRRGAERADSRITGGPRRTDEVDGASDYRVGKGDVSATELRRIMPGLSAAKARDYLPHLNSAMHEAGITGKDRQAAFLAQLAHESGGLKYMEEIASGSAYEGRRDLGNVRSGDGRRFKGRGPIQLTGRANYREAGRALDLNLEGNPEQAKRPSVAFRVAAWFWKSRGLNGLADRGAFREITQRINGGFNGLSDRFHYWARAKKVL